MGLATGLFELQLLGYTVGLQEGFASGLGLEGGLRSSRGLAATSEGPLRELLGSRFGSRFGSGAGRLDWLGKLRSHRRRS